MFAAGFGTRMRPLTADMPKPMVPVGGRPLIDHALALAKGVASGPIVANLHYKPQMLVDHLMPQGVATIIEAPDILETGGGLRNALPLLGQGPVYTMNTDAIWAGPNPLAALASAWRPDVMDGLLMLIQPDLAKGYAGQGDFTLHDDGTLSRGAGMIYGGVQIIKTDMLHDIQETAFSLNLLWDLMLADRTLHGLAYTGRWCDVGHPGGIAQAETLLAAHDV